MEALIRTIETFETFEGDCSLTLENVPAAPGPKEAANVHRHLRAAWQRRTRELRDIREIRVSLPRDAVWLRAIPGFLGTPDRFGDRGDGRWHLTGMSLEGDRIALGLRRSSRCSGRIDPRRGSHLLVVATAARRRFIGRTVGYLLIDGHQEAIREHRSPQFPNPVTAAAHSLASVLEDVAEQGVDGELSVWTAHEALRMTLGGEHGTRVPQIHHALARLSDAAGATEVELNARGLKRGASVAREIVARWTRLSIEQLARQL